MGAAWRHMLTRPWGRERGGGIGSAAWPGPKVPCLARPCSRPAGLQPTVTPLLPETRLDHERRLAVGSLPRLASVPNMVWRQVEQAQGAVQISCTGGLGRPRKQESLLKCLPGEVWPDLLTWMSRSGLQTRSNLSSMGSGKAADTIAAVRFPTCQGGRMARLKEKKPEGMPPICTPAAGSPRSGGQSDPWSSPLWPLQGSRRPGRQQTCGRKWTHRFRAWGAV